MVSELSLTRTLRQASLRTKMTRMTRKKREPQEPSLIPSRLKSELPDYACPVRISLQFLEHVLTFS